MGTLLIFASVVIRAWATFSGRSSRGWVLLLLAAYGLLLLARQRRPDWFTAVRARASIYLGLQSSFVLALMLIPLRHDFFPLLFVPLSWQAVEMFGRRAGFTWIGGCTLAMLSLYTLGPRVWGQLYFAIDPPTGVAMTILYGALCFYVGQIAHVRQQAEAARQANQRLLTDLQAAHRRLQDQATQLEELAVMQERGRLARELHDSVTQTVFSMTLAVQAARVLLDKDAGRVAAQLDRVAELARNASREVQAIVKQLRPVSIAEKGLAAALREFLAERQARDGLIAHLEVGDAPADAQWPEEVTLGLYRIVQEAVNNVIKHAGTREVTITLDLNQQPARVEVTDRGTGFVMSDLAPQRGHMGLASMAERARELGWTLTVDSRPGRGTCVKVTAS